MPTLAQLRARPAGILGWGRFGRALTPLLAENGWKTKAYDTNRNPPEGVAVAGPGELARASGLVIVAVPLASMRVALEQLAPHLGPEHLVVDVGSVKQRPVEAMAELLGARCAWLGTHPLFGPTSLALGEFPLRVVICPRPDDPDAQQAGEDLFRALGCEVHLREPAEHDREMAESHALAYFVAKALMDAGLAIDSPLAPPSARAIARTVEAVRSDAGHLLGSLHRENPHAPGARERFLEALVEIDRELDRPPADRPSAESASGPLAIPGLGERSPELREVRDLIDDLDRELVRLLARRARLARRALHAKTGIGAGVRDAERESSLLERRREWAADSGLDPAEIGHVFEAVLRFSRRLQQGRGNAPTGEAR